MCRWNFWGELRLCLTVGMFNKEHTCLPKLDFHIPLQIMLTRGVKLLLECSEEDYQVAMLVCLSKIASRSTIPISEQALPCVRTLSGQLRNVPSDIPLQFHKLYCLLFCKVSFLESKVIGKTSKQGATAGCL